MSYDDVEIEDMEWNEELKAYTYPCPCGDLFQITKEDLRLGEEIARCPSCSLYITVIYNMEDFLGDNNDQNKNKNLEPSKQQPLALKKSSTELNAAINNHQHFEDFQQDQSSLPRIFVSASEHIIKITSVVLSTMKRRTVAPETFYRIIDESVLYHHKLMLPDEFVQKYGSELSNVVKINVPVDRIWLIGVERAGKTIWLHDGWQAFMECHSICFGHFLIFNYKGNSKFDLHIFDVTATEIQYPFTNARSHASENSGQENDKFGLYNDDSMVDSPLQISMAASLELDAQHENTAKGVQGVKARANIDRSSPEHDTVEGIQGRKRTFHATTSEPDNPSFTVTMKPYNIERSFIVPIPTEFVKENLSNDIDYIELQDSDGKKWPVRCIRSSSKTTCLSKGWLPFARANKLVKGDICVFELIHENEAMLKVSIFPAKNKHAR